MTLPQRWRTRLERWTVTVAGLRLMAVFGGGYWKTLRMLHALRTGFFAAIFDWKQWPKRPPAHWAAHWQHIYEIEVAPRRAIRWGWLYRLIAAILKSAGVRFVVNVFPGMGHNTVELDYFFRRRKTGEWPEHFKFVLARRPNPVHLDTMTLYGHRFWLASMSVPLFNLILPLTMRCRDIDIDCGLSRLKWQIEGDGWSPAPQGQTFLHQISKEEVGLAWKKYYEIRAVTADFFPLRDGLGVDDELLTFLGGRADNLALVHVKLHVMNATGAPTDPRSYLDAMVHLRAKGYRLVFVGREEMPTCFAELDVINYAQSPIASYKHDLQIFGAAKLAITAGSGIALMPDCMGIPLVYLDSWHIGMPLFSASCISVPALVEDARTGRPIPFDAQIKLYETLPDHGDEVFPAGWRARNASSDEIVAAVQELLDLIDAPGPRSDLQDRFCQLRKDGLLGLTQSRVSEFFLNKHRDLFAPTE